ncbi:hypothetical protein ONZ45_g15114 [Pleurotus djamor]|nr:hypothetical protein ONZ45_g15114 [Pleurotus djamor]
MKGEAERSNNYSLLRDIGAGIEVICKLVEVRLCLFIAAPFAPPPPPTPPLPPPPPTSPSLAAPFALALLALKLPLVPGPLLPPIDDKCELDALLGLVDELAIFGNPEFPFREELLGAPEARFLQPKIKHCKLEEAK